MKIKILITVLVFLILFSGPAFAQYSTQDWATPTIRIFFGPDVPAEYLTSNNFFQMLILPWLAIWFVMWGILEELRIFRRKTSLNAVIAFLISFMAGATGGMLGVVRWMYGWAGVYGALAFGALMFVGISLWFAVRLSSWTGWWKGSLTSAKDYIAKEEEIDKLKAEMERLKIAKAGAPAGAEQAYDAQIQKAIEYLKKLAEEQEKREKEMKGKPEHMGSYE